MAGQAIILFYNYKKIVTMLTENEKAELMIVAGILRDLSEKVKDKTVVKPLQGLELRILKVCGCTRH